MLLAFDTATPAVTVALHDGTDVVAESTIVDPRRHGELLAPGVVAVLEEAGVPRQDITAIAVGVGPGPFTGLRVGIVTALMLGAVLEIPVYGVCTLDVLAVEAYDSGSVHGGFLVATDARRKEVYWAAYDAQARRVDGPHVAKPATIATDRPVVGAGALLYPEWFGAPVAPTHPRAAVLAAVVNSERVELLDPEPLYLRRPDVMPPSKPKKVS